MGVFTQDLRFEAVFCDAGYVLEVDVWHPDVNLPYHFNNIHCTYLQLGRTWRAFVGHSLRDKMGQVRGHVVTFVTRPSQSQFTVASCLRFLLDGEQHHIYQNIVATMKLE